MLCEVPLTKEQQTFATAHHSLVYKFLNENRLPEDEFYDVVIFGYLKAVRDYFSDLTAQQFTFSTIANRRMKFCLFDYFRTQERRKHLHSGTVARGVCLFQYSRIAALYRSLILFKSDGRLAGEQRKQSFFFLLYCLVKRCEAFIGLEHICFIFAVIERSEKAWVCRKGYSRWCRAGKRRRNVFECGDDSGGVGGLRPF